MELKLKQAINQKFAWLPPKTVIDLLMSHTRVQVCKKQENFIDEKYQLICKLLLKTLTDSSRDFLVWLC
jgi:hypothetical protein